MSLSANYRPFSALFVISPSGEFCQVSELNILSTKWSSAEGMFIWSNIGLENLGDRRQDICKDKESNLGPVAGYSGGNYPELSCIFVLRAKCHEVELNKLSSYQVTNNDARLILREKLPIQLSASRS